MAMSDCEECWETPCCCGHSWRRFDLKRLKEIRDVIDVVIKEKEPKPEFMDMADEALFSINGGYK